MATYKFGDPNDSTNCNWASHDLILEASPPFTGRYIWLGAITVALFPLGERSLYVLLMCKLSITACFTNHLAQFREHIQHRPRDSYFLYRDFAIADCVFSRDCPRSFEPEVQAFAVIHAALVCMNYTRMGVLTDLIKMIWNDINWMLTINVCYFIKLFIWTYCTLDCVEFYG